MQTIWMRDGFRISTDKTAQDAQAIHAFLNKTYWAANRSLATVKQSIENSLCFGLYTESNEQIGFARVLTDFAVVSYVFDVYVLPVYQGKGLGRWLMQTVVNHPEIAQTNMVLATKDKHAFYEYAGFIRHKTPERIMVLSRNE